MSLDSIKARAQILASKTADAARRAKDYAVEFNASPEGKVARVVALGAVVACTLGEVMERIAQEV